jgi:hypothetical protein
LEGSSHEIACLKLQGTFYLRHPKYFDMQKTLSFFLLSFLISQTIDIQAQSGNVKYVPANSASASNKPAPKSALLLGGALELGGDAIAVVSFQDGSTQKVNAGQGGTFFAGGEWNLGKEAQWAIRATLGIKYVTTKATNANITLTRIPIRLTGLRQLGKKWWIAAGAVTHQSIRFNAGGIGQDQQFTGTLSPTFELGYSAVSFVFTPMTYKDEAGASYKAGSAGLAFNVPVRRKR